MVTDEDATVAHRIRSALDANGGSIKHLSEASGIPRSTLNRKLEHGSFTIAELRLIADVLHTTIYDLIPHEVAA